MKWQMLIIVFSVLIAFGVTSSSAGQKLKLGTGEWGPISNSKMAEKGLASELIKSAFAEVGIEVEILFYPWKRAEVMVEKGDLDGVFPLSRTEERIGKFLYSEPIAHSPCQDGLLLSPE